MKRILFFLWMGSGFLFSCGNDTSHVEEEPIDPQPLMTTIDTMVYKERGKMIAGQTFQALSSTLRSKMEEGGPELAVDFCRLHALPITDSVARANEAMIRRTALRWRNPANAPDSIEKVNLEKMTTYMQEGREPEVAILEEGDSVRFFAPIVMQPLCSNCHGSPSTFSEELQMVLSEEYPEDHAVGFQPGELRGMWSIKMKK